MSVDSIFALRHPLVWTPVEGLSAPVPKLFGKLTVPDLRMPLEGIVERVQRLFRKFLWIQTITLIMRGRFSCALRKAPFERLHSPRRLLPCRNRNRLLHPQRQPENRRHDPSVDLGQIR